MSSSLFQTLTYSARDIAFLPSSAGLSPLASLSPPPPAALPALPKLARNTASGALPVVLHFNGGEKSLLAGTGSWWERMWFVSGGEGARGEREEVKEWVRERVRRGGVRVAETGEWVGWEEMGCEREDVWGET